MRKLILGAALAAFAWPVATIPAAAATTLSAETAIEHDASKAQRGDRRDRRRDWRNYRRYDHDRYEPGRRGYYADDYYRDGRYYRERRLTRNDRIYRGRNGRYYCRRDDGTTGLIIGGAVGALLGDALSSGRSNTLGVILGAGAGAALGSEIDRGRVRCR